MARFDRVIPPGQEGTIVAVVKTDKLLGRVSKGLTARTNDPQLPAASLQVTLEVHSWVEVLPAWRAVFQAERGTPARQVLHIRSRDPENPVRILAGASTVRGLKLTVEPVAPEDADVGSGAYRVVLELPGDLPIGPLSGVVTLTTSHPEQRTVDIPVEGRVNGPIAFYPAQVVMFADSSGRAPRLSGTIVLQARGETPVVLESLEADDPRLKLVAAPDGSGRMVRIAVTWTESEAKGVHHGTIRIRTGNQAMPLIEVPYQVRID